MSFFVFNNHRKKVEGPYTIYDENTKHHCYYGIKFKGRKISNSGAELSEAKTITDAMNRAYAQGIKEGKKL